MQASTPAAPPTDPMSPSVQAHGPSDDRSTSQWASQRHGLLAAAGGALLVRRRRRAAPITLNQWDWPSPRR
jgi:MYXO-CTERM domain-containing protein